MKPLFDADPESLPPPRIAERWALAAAQEVAGERILCTTIGRAQAAAQLAAQRPSAQVTCWFLDDFSHRRVAETGAASPNLSLLLSADVPDETFNLAVVPLSKSGEAELTRDLLQTAWLRLEVGGVLIATVDNPHDHWVRAQLGDWFDRVRTIRHSDAVVYVASKDSSPRRVRSFRCEFAFRDRGRLLRAVSRPGVFSHRRVDPGARQLLAAADPPPRSRIVEIGCGSGVMSLALAARDPQCSVLAVDSHTRAVECTLAGTELNALSNASTLLNSTGDFGAPGVFDLALLNPPYYANFAVAQLFLAAAHRTLRIGGQMLAVTKRPAWYLENLPAAWTNVEARPSKGYHVVSALKR